MQPGRTPKQVPEPGPDTLENVVKAIVRTRLDKRPH